MRLRYLALLLLVLAAGCLVPRYDVDPLSTSTGGQANVAGRANVAGKANAGSATDAAGTMSAAAGATALDCTADQKICKEKCVDIDDVNYGCTPTSCNMTACPAAGSATLTCADGECVIGTCGEGSKKCAGKCVAISDPSYGCDDESCDASSCPDPGSGTLVCEGKTCSVGVCGAGTKQCGNKCVPLDENNGCSDPKDCTACDSSETCVGTPSVCMCEGDGKDACTSQWCGTAVNNCGEKVDCQNYCRAPTPVCFENDCAECNVAADCPGPGDNVCAVATCSNHKCGYIPVDQGTRCPGGYCHTTVAGICVRPVVSVDGVFSIDGTEVTQGAFYQFVKAKGDSTAQLSSCSWNTFGTGAGAPVEPAMKDYDYPVMVNWCSAYAYCKWAGRRLCGKIGGGALADDGAAIDPKQSQWIHACSGPSNFAYPYGEDYVDNRCNGPHAQSTVAPVASHKQCVGAYPGLYDMSGNVAEWLDLCADTAGNAQCTMIGGNYAQFADLPAQTSTRCDFIAATTRGTDATGFRCCSP